MWRKSCLGGRIHWTWRPVPKGTEDLFLTVPPLPRLPRSAHWPPPTPCSFSSPLCFWAWEVQHYRQRQSPSRLLRTNTLTHKPEVSLFLSHGGAITWPWHLLGTEVPGKLTWRTGTQNKGNWMFLNFIYRMAKPGAVSSCRGYQLRSHTALSSEPNSATVLSCENLNTLLNFSEPVSSALKWH